MHLVGCGEFSATPEGPKRKRTVGDRLRAAGFDTTEWIREERYWRVGCSECQAIVVNGTACHEHNCPNQRNRR